MSPPSDLCCILIAFLTWENEEHVSFAFLTLGSRHVWRRRTQFPTVGPFSFFFSSSSSLAIFFLFSVIHRPLSTYSTAVRLLSHCVCGCERTRLGRHKEVSYWPRCWLHPVSSNAVNYAFTAGRSRAHIVRAFIAFAGHCDAWLFKSRSA